MQDKETRPQQEELAGKFIQDPRQDARPRQGTGRGKVLTAARYLPRQGACRGKVRHRTTVLSLQCPRQRSILGPSRHAWQCTVPSGADGTSAFPISKVSRYTYLDS